jgi:hypothetical protein
MFICQYSGELSEKNEKPVRIAVEFRNKEYKNTYRDEEGYQNVTTYGSEIVKEILVRVRHLEEIRRKYNLESPE